MQRRVYKSFWGRTEQDIKFIILTESSRINSNWAGVGRKMGMKKAIMESNFKLREQQLQWHSGPRYF